MPRKINPKSLANLKPWQPGQSGNPEGINRKRPITDRYYQRSEEKLPESLRKKFNEKVGEEILGLGASWGDANAAQRFLDAIETQGAISSKEIREAIEGKAPQRLEISGPERKEISIKVSFDRKTK